MPSITIKDIPSTLHQRLIDAAARHRRSLQNEVVACLERYVDQIPKPKAELLAEATALRDRLPSVDHDLVDQFKCAGRP